MRPQIFPSAALCQLMMLELKLRRTISRQEPNDAFWPNCKQGCDTPDAPFLEVGAINRRANSIVRGLKEEADVGWGY